MSFFKLLELAYRLPSISESEWEAKLLSRETQKRLGLRSPKLSKFLLGKKVPETVLQKVMLKKTSTYFSPLLLEQGDSLHYSSCQARDPRAKWFKEGKLSLWEEGDLQAYQEGHLLMWVAGRPMSEDGKGFKARAKIRMVYAKEGSLLGVYVDRVYGQSELLREEDLSELLFEEFGHEVPILEIVYDSLKGEEGTIPSSSLGYQDTLRYHRTRFFHQKKKDTLEEWLSARLATPLWLRQEYRDKIEGVREPRIPIWRPRTPKHIQKLKKLLNMPKSLKIAKEGAKWVFKFETEKWCWHYFTLYIISSKEWTLCLGSRRPVDFIYRSKGRLWVVLDCPEMGFYKSEPI